MPGIDWRQQWIVEFRGTVDSTIETTDLILLYVPTGDIPTPAFTALEIVSAELGIVSKTLTANVNLALYYRLLEDVVTEGTISANTIDDANVYHQDPRLDSNLDFPCNAVYMADVLATSDNSVADRHYSTWNIQNPYKRIYHPDERPFFFLGYQTGAWAGIAWRLAGELDADLPIWGKLVVRAAGVLND